jgi:MFS family permease
LTIANYRLFLLGQIVSVSGTWIQRVAQDWLVLDITHNSGTALGIASGLQFLPTLLFGVWGGLLADRNRKRHVLMVTQACMGLTALTLGILTIGGHVQLWHVYAIAFTLGLATAIDNPARQSFLIELVGRERLANAVGLNSATFNIARMVGPAAGGILLSLFGAGPSFLLNALSYVAVLLALAGMREEALWIESPAPRGRRQVREGLRYVLEHRNLLIIMCVVFFAGTFGMNWPVLLALTARSVYHTGPEGYGVMFTALAAGSLVGALLAASRSGPRLRYIVGAAVGLGLLEVTASRMPTFTAFLVLLIPLGMLALTMNTSANSTVQLLVPYDMRGRVMAVYLLANSGGTPIGAPLQGWVAEHYGARSAFLLAGSVSTMAGLLAIAIIRRGRDGGLLPLRRRSMPDVDHRSHV